MNNCKHELMTYNGFTDTYEYCKLCNLKQSEIEMKKSDEVTHLKPGEMAIPRGLGRLYLNAAYDFQRGLESLALPTDFMVDTTQSDNFFGVNRFAVSSQFSPSEEDDFTYGGTIVKVNRHCRTITIELDDDEDMYNLEINQGIIFNRH